MTISRDEMTPLKRAAVEAHARQMVFEEAFVACPSWRPRKRERLRDERTYWRLTAMHARRRWLESLPPEEALATFGMDP